mgnify:CR=1 FL=1
MSAKASNPSLLPRRGSFAAAMRALGHEDLPALIVIDGQPHHRVRTVKHDFFAATGFYQDAAGRRAVVKISRKTDFFGLPMEWLGRFLCRREVRFYRELADLPNVPPVIGLIGRTGFAHCYVPGRPLAKGVNIPDTFFDELNRLMTTLHERGIAYVDTNKPENILLGNDGRPHLIDFQISLSLRDLGDHVLARWVLRKFANADRYHICKHKRRLRPDLLRPEEAEIVERRSWPIRLHRFLTRPYFVVRRRLMRRLQERGHILPAGSN